MFARRVGSFETMGAEEVALRLDEVCGAARLPDRIEITERS